MLSVQTVSGIEEKDFTRRKLKLRTYQVFIRNYETIVVGLIRKEEWMVKEYVQTIVVLLRMDAANKEYFLSRVSEHPVDIQMLIGLRGQESLLTTVREEQINCLYPLEPPNVTIYHSMQPC